MARTIRRSQMEQDPPSDIKDDPSCSAREVETQEIAITRQRLEHDPRFLQRIEQARSSLRAGRGVKLEDVEVE